MSDQTFECPTCKREVVYRRIVLPSLRGETAVPAEPQVVYLTCAENHTHPYSISV